MEISIDEVTIRNLEGLAKLFYYSCDKMTDIHTKKETTKVVS